VQASLCYSSRAVLKMWARVAASKCAPMKMLATVQASPLNAQKIRTSRNISEMEHTVGP
jgi:hypothetical protein